MSGLPDEYWKDNPIFWVTIVIIGLATTVVCLLRIRHRRVQRNLYPNLV